MMLTEKEASTRWCPFTRIGAGTVGQVVPVNRLGNGDIDTRARCIGSRCMAWRWNGMHPTFKGEPIGEKTGSCGLASASPLGGVIMQP